MSTGLPTQLLLENIPPRVRRQLANALGLASSNPEVVAAQLASPERIRAALARLGPVERDALSLLVFGMGGSGMRDLLQYELNQLHSSERRQPQALAALERAGLISPADGVFWEVFVYEELKKPVIDAVYGWLVDRARPWVERAAPAPAVDPAGVVADLARLLGALSAGVRVTKKGDVRKTDHKRLLAAFDAGRPWPLPQGFPGWAGYEAPLGPALALLAQLGLIAAADGTWRASKAAEVWIGLHAAAQWKSLVAAWRDLGLARARGPMHDLLGICQVGPWVDYERFSGALARYLPDDGQALLAGTIVFLQIGVAIGALQLAQAAGNRMVVRMTPAAAAALRERPVPLPDFDEAVIVQPDFEVVVPPRVPAPVIWGLERWAERLGVDRVARYRITRASIGRQSRTGEPVTQWLDSLAAASRFGIPENVRFSVQDWSERPARAQMETAVILRLSEGPPAGLTLPGGIRRLGPDTWVVDLAHAVSVFNHLARAGIQVDGNPAEWPHLARARAKLQPAGGPAAVELPWPGPAAGDRRTAFRDEPPATVVSPGEEAAAAAEAGDRAP